MWHLDPITSFDMLISLSFILFVDLMLVGTETWIFADKMKKNYIAKSIYAVSFHLEYLRNNLRRFIQRLPKIVSRNLNWDIFCKNLKKLL